MSGGLVGVVITLQGGVLALLTAGAAAGQLTPASGPEIQIAATANFQSGRREKNFGRSQGFEAESYEIASDTYENASDPYWVTDLDLLDRVRYEIVSDTY